MKYFSTFSGIGGFELGINKAYENLSITSRKKQRRNKKNSANSKFKQLATQQPTCVGYSEIDKYAIQVYQKHFTKQKNYGDITKIKPATIENFDLFTGGFPCQTFSIAGKRRGFNDIRGTLFFSIVKILKAKRPKNFLLENVKGLLSHDNGRTFKTIIAVLAELGYCVEWQVLNAKNFGVPQNRERVFIVGHFGGIPKQKVFPLGENDEISIETNKTEKPQSQASIASTIRTKEGTRSDDNFIVLDKKGKKKKNKKCASCLTGGGHSGGNHSDMDLIQLNNPIHSNNRVYSKKGISPALRTMQGGNRQPFIAEKRTDEVLRTFKDNIRTKKDCGDKVIIHPVLTPDRLNKRQNGRRMKDSGDPSFTLTGQDKHGIYDGSKIRRLTPLECERLMGFPDHWTKYGIGKIGDKTVIGSHKEEYIDPDGLKKKSKVQDFGKSKNEIVKISDTQRYKMCGNAVVANCVEEIIKKLYNLKS